MSKNMIPIALAIMLMLIPAFSYGCDEDEKEDVILKGPECTFKVFDENGAVYSDPMILQGPGIKVNGKMLKITAECKGKQYPVLVERYVSFTQADILQPDAGGRYELISGNNELHVYALAPGTNDRWIDRTWFRVFYKSPVPATIEPAILEGTTNQFYSFTAKANSEPVIGSYEWKLDGNLLGKGAGATLRRKFTEPGTYKLTVAIYDKFHNEACGEGEAVVHITE